MDLYVRPPDSEGNVEIDQTLGETSAPGDVGGTKEPGMVYMC